MKMKCLSPLYISICLILFTNLNSQIPAFPGAEGFGSKTVGGRGGRVIAVTNLHSKGPGSLRVALQASGRRIVVFKTGGTIWLKKNINIKYPFITISGQTAPGDGILIRGAAIAIGTHDVIMRGLRIRVGDSPLGPAPDNRDGISIGKKRQPTFNIIIDHCSISWAIDENIQLFYTNYDISIQMCIISEGLRNSLHSKGEHSNGILVGGGGVTKRISIHKNIFAHNFRRNPRIAPGNAAEIINNIVFNWRIGTTVSGNVNVIGNMFIAGKNTGHAKGIILPNWSEKGYLYVNNNIGPGRMSNTGDEWLVVDGPVSNQLDAPAIPLSNVAINDVANVFEFVLNNAGAIVPCRDSVDKRIIKDINNKTGTFIDSQNDVNGWPVLSRGISWPDTDNDGIDDNWEIKNFNNLSMNAADDHDNDGYTIIEEYVNSLIKILE